MGGTLSSNDSISTFLKTLLSGACPPSHPIWNNISIQNFNTSEITKEDFQLLTEVRDKRPDNFAELVRFFVESFMRYIKVAETEAQSGSMFDILRLYSDTTCLLLSISGLPQKISPWFKAPTLYLSSVAPFHQLMQAEFRLLNLTDSIFNSYADELNANITFAKTLLFMQQSEAFTYQVSSDPSPYITSFDTFPANVYLPSFFEFIPKAIMTTRSEPILKFVKALITATILPIYTCNTWKTALSNVEQNTLHAAFVPLLSLYDNIYVSGVPGRVLACSEELVSLLYAVILRYPTFLKFIDINKLSQRYITVLLLLFRYKMDNSSITFIHSIILLIISHLTSDFHSLLSLNDPFVGPFPIKDQRPHKGSFADLIIEIITYPLVKDFKSCFPLAPLVTAIIQNLSSTTGHLSFFNANRIFEVLRLFFKSKAAESPDSKLPIARLLNAIYQFIAFQTLGKKSILLYGIVNRVIINSVATCSLREWKLPAEKIKKILDAADEPLKSKAKNADVLLQNAIAPILAEFNDSPVPQTAFTMGPEVETIWYDWARILLWRVFPEESEFYHLNFLTFKQSGFTPKQPNPVPEESLSKEEAKMIDEKPQQQQQQAPLIIETRPDNPLRNPVVARASPQQSSQLKNESEDENDEDEDPQTSITKIIEATRSQSQRNAKLVMRQMDDVPEQLETPVKHVKTLEELDNPFGSEDEDELAKFLED